jgi:hypothetical protein
MGRSSNSIKNKAQNLRLKKDGPPTVKAEPRPRSLSVAVTTEPVLTALPGFQQAEVLQGVALLDHHLGQCRWIVSDVWPVRYCGAPVVNSSSWCEQHSRRVFNARLQSQGASLFPLSKIFR